MSGRRRMNKKKINLNPSARDIYEHWSREYSESRGTEYVPATSVLHSLTLIKKSFESFPQHVVYLSVKAALRRNCFSVPFFIDNLDDYLPETEYTELMYMVLIAGDKKRKRLWKELLFIGETPQDPDEARRQREIIEELGEWKQTAITLKVD